jgi:hypothetical protein
VPTTEDDDNVLRDQQVLRVPLYAMDSLQRSVRAHRLQDALGNPAGYRPGPVYLVGLDDTPARKAASDYERFLSDAWKDKGPQPVNMNVVTPTHAYRAYVEQLGDAWRSK